MSTIMLFSFSFLFFSFFISLFFVGFFFFFWSHCCKEKIVLQLEKNLCTLKSSVQLDRKFNIGNANPNLLLSRIQTQPPYAHEFMNFHLQNVHERKGDDHILCSDQPHLCTPTEPLHLFHDPGSRCSFLWFREYIKTINQPAVETGAS